MNDFFTFIFFLLNSIFLIKISIGIFKNFFADIPNKRSSHKKIKPKGAGIIFVFNVILSYFFINSKIFLISVPLAIIGLADDKYNLPRVLRFISQIITVFLILYFFNNFKEFIVNFNFIYMSILLLLGTSVINFSNFMDGIDGIVAGCFLVIFICSSILLDINLIPLSASLVSFLLFNWYPSKIFMGDVGSTFLGSIYFTILCQSNNLNQFFGILFMSAPLMLDALTCVIRRALSGRKIFNPHRDHLYQRLTDNNISQSEVALIYIFSTLAIALSYLLGGLSYALFIVILVCGLGLYLDQKIALDFYSK